MARSAAITVFTSLAPKYFSNWAGIVSGGPPSIIALIVCHRSLLIVSYFCFRLTNFNGNFIERVGGSRRRRIDLNKTVPNFILSIGQVPICSKNVNFVRQSLKQVRKQSKHAYSNDFALER